MSVDVAAIPATFADGTAYVDLQAAVQAAWLAGDLPLCVDLVRRYGLTFRVCFACGEDKPLHLCADSTGAVRRVHVCGDCLDTQWPEARTR